MAKQKYWNGTTWEVIGTDADKVELKDSSNLFSSNNVEDALKELFINVSNGKKQLETAITDKNGMVSKVGDVPTFDELNAGIRSIPQAKGNASPSDVLAGKTFSSENAGIEVVGTMPNVGQQIITPSTVNQAILPGYHNGLGYVEGDPNLKPENIKSGVNIFGVTGNLDIKTIIDISTINVDESVSDYTIKYTDITINVFAIILYVYVRYDTSYDGEYRQHNCYGSLSSISGNRSLGIRKNDTDEDYSPSYAYLYFLDFSQYGSTVYVHIDPSQFDVVSIKKTIFIGL